MNNDWWDYLENRNNLYHWKYIKKIGNRYFYTMKELKAFMDGNKKQGEYAMTNKPDTYTFNQDMSYQNDNGTYAYGYFDKEGDEKDSVWKKIKKVKKAYKEFNQNNNHYLNNWHGSMPEDQTQPHDPDKPEHYSSSAINFLFGKKRPRERKKYVGVEMHDGHMYLSAGGVQVGANVDHPVSKIKDKAAKYKRKLKDKIFY